MSILPPSFASFPDFEGESSKVQQERESSKGDSKDKNRKRDRDHRQDRSDSPLRREKGKDRERHRSHHDKEKHKGKEKERGDEKRRRREERRKHEVNDRDDYSSTGVDDSYRLFFVDRKPDTLNLHYGGLHQGDVPKYRFVAGGRRVLGLSPAFVVVRRLGKGIEIGLRNATKMSGISDSRTKALLAAPPTRRLVGDQQSDKYHEVDGFIGIPSRRGKTAPEDTYRSITRGGAGDSSASESDNSEYSAEDDEDSQDETIPENSHQAHLRTLEQRLSAQPNSVDTWTSLLEHTLSTIPVTSKNATKARSDIAVSILSRALSAHPANSLSKILRIKYLKAGEEILQPGELAEEWEKALKVGGIEIWMEWLEWRLRQSKHVFSDFIGDVSRALAAFGDSEQDQLAKLRIFWRTGVATRSAGYSERSFAMFQAQAEFTFNMPNSLVSSSFQQQLDGLEEFWESETSRFGEAGATGWSAWYGGGKPEFHPWEATSNVPPQQLDLDPYRQWSAHELLTDRLQFNPSRTSMDSDDLDPYSAILFSDVRPAIIQLQSPQTKDAFRLVFLSFLGLHLPGFSQSLSPNQEINWDDRWSFGGLAGSGHIQGIFPTETQSRAILTDSISGVVVAREKEYNDDTPGPVKHWGFGVVQPLDASVGPRNVSRQTLWDSAQMEGVDVHLIRRVFSQPRVVDNDFSWDSLALAFEASLNIKNALKLSKAFLSSAKDDLDYWAAHAQLERINGKLDGARKVYQTVLIASKSAKSQPAVSQMWWNWAEMEWLAGKDEQALHVILQSAGIPKASDIGILRARHSLQESTDSASTPHDAENWLKLHALLELLRDADISAVLPLFDRQLQGTTDSLARERLVVASLLFVYYYRVILKRPMPPALLRERAGKALEEYPSNSIVLRVFLEAEKGQGIWGRVRSMLAASNHAKDVARVMEEVWVGGWEKGRWASEVERIRAGLAAAVEIERTRASATIWRLYIELEIQAGQLQSAKKLLFRAISECPFVKEIYLLAFGALRSVFDGRELQGLVDLMAERGIRLRQDLHEAIEDVEEESNEEEGPIQDEIEHNAEELRRLMPY